MVKFIHTHPWHNSLLKQWPTPNEKFIFTVIYFDFSLPGK